MATAYLSLGSNLGDRLDALERGVAALDRQDGVRVERVSSAYETPAHLPPGAPDDWIRPYLNIALVLSTSRSPQDLLTATQSVERHVGRTPAPVWAPRVLDVDIVSFDDCELATEALTLPHPRAAERAFVLAPLAEIAPTLVLPGYSKSVVQLSAELKDDPAPAWMQIVNVTPDSFSGDGSAEIDPDQYRRCNYIDIGAESTRPGAEYIAPDREWQRLQPVLSKLTGGVVRPRISLDTRHTDTARRALDEFAVDVINDVNALRDPGMIELIAERGCDVVLMHSLTVPADPARVLENADPVSELVEWFQQRLERLESLGIERARVITDPGLGFGKSAHQSWQLLRSIRALRMEGCRLLVGHSRKSFLANITHLDAPERDAETLAVSNRMIADGVNILRVHNADLHQRYRHAHLQFRTRP